MNHTRLRMKMKKTNILCFIVFLSNSISVHGVEFFPFANQTNDLTLPRQDDAFTTISLNFDIPFFGELFQEIHLSTNGIIFFGQGSTQYVPSPFPLNGTKCVAAYWVDSDPRMGGDIFYREIFDPDILQSISNEIRTKFINSGSFRSSWAFIVTFHNVSRYGCGGIGDNSCQNVVNHQTILTSNGIESFVIFLYDKLGYSKAQIGFNAGDGKRYFMLPNSNTENISTYALLESNVGEPGKWSFSITNEISSACSLSGLLEIYPKKVLYFGGQEIFITGPCFATDQTHLIVMFEDLRVNCSVTDNLKITCISPYVDRLGRVSLFISHDGMNYTSFIIAHDEGDNIVKSSKFEVSQDDIDTPFNLTWDANISGQGNILISGMQEDITIDANGYVIGLSRYQISMKVPNTGTFQYQPSLFVHYGESEIKSAANIRHIGLFIPGIVVMITIKAFQQFSCDVWYLLEPNEQEIGQIKNRESRRNPCQPSVPPNFPPTLPGNFIKDGGCNPSSPGSCDYFHRGAKGCYRSTNNPDNIAVQCCYNNDNQLLIGPPGGGTLDMYDSNKNIFNHFVKDVIPYILCCKLVNKCDKYYEKRPSVDSSDFVPPVVIRANGDPHFTTLDDVSYEFNPVGEFIYLQAPELMVQTRIAQYIDMSGIPKPGSYFSAFAIKSSTSEIVQIGLTVVKSLQVKVGNDILYPGTWSLGNISVDNSNSSVVSVESSEGFKLQIQCLNGMLHAIVMLEQRLKYKVSGLIGNWDDNPQNDFMLPNKTFIPITSSNRDIHYMFGMQWTTTESTSIFSYPEGLSWKEFQNVNFIPFFDTPPPDSRCLGDTSCLFDLHVTGEINIALSNIEVKKQTEEIKTEIKEISETCLRNINITNGKVIIDYDVNDAMNVVYHISCNTGFKLSGSAIVKCIKGKYSEKFGNCQEYKPISSSSFSNKHRFENLMFTFVLVYLLFNLIRFI